MEDRLQRIIGTKTIDGQRAQGLGGLYGRPDARGGLPGQDRLHVGLQLRQRHQTSGVVKIVKDLDLNLEGYDLLLVEDILDSGRTLYYLREILEKRNPASIRIATLLNKPARREADIAPDYSCFEVPDEFVVGYGLDYAEKYRNLPYIGVLKPEVYTK